MRIIWIVVVASVFIIGPGCRHRQLQSEKELPSIPFNKALWQCHKLGTVEMRNVRHQMSAHVCQLIKKGTSIAYVQALLGSPDNIVKNVSPSGNPSGVTLSYGTGQSKDGWLRSIFVNVDNSGFVESILEDYH